MIQLNLVALIYLFFSSINSQDNTLKAINELPNSKLMFSQDSGFVIKKDGLPFLLANSLTDTINSFWDLINENDTIGKYYKVDQTGNYFFCSIDHSSNYGFETHILIELNPNGKTIKSTRFFHGNYPCCWNNYYDGFHKYGNYFGIETCGTGSGYCSSDLYLFKKMIPQKKQNPIRLNYWMANEPEIPTESLSSTLEFKKDSLIVHYKFETGELEFSELDDSLNFKVLSTKLFDVHYFVKNNKWIAREKNALNSLSPF